MPTSKTKSSFTLEEQIKKIEFHGSQVAETKITAKHPPTDSVAILFFW